MESHIIIIVVAGLFALYVLGCLLVVVVRAVLDNWREYLEIFFMGFLPKLATLCLGGASIYLAWRFQLTFSAILAVAFLIALYVSFHMWPNEDFVERALLGFYGCGFFGGVASFLFSGFEPARTASLSDLCHP